MWSLLLPPSCPVCGRAGAAPCTRCWADLEPAPPGPAPPGVEWCRSLLRYEGAGRELLARTKYRNARSAVPWLAGGMAGLAAGPGGTFDLVTWAPTTAARRRRRGFDPAEILARAVGRRLRVPVRRLLVRLPGPPQTGQGGVGRRCGPRFVVYRRARVPPRVLLVDDVLTTGATLSAAASALRAAGPVVVAVVTGGRTALKIPAPQADA